MTEERNTARFLQAAALLPPALRRQAEALDRESQGRTEELRLRAGRPMTAVLPEGERPLSGEPVCQEELYAVLEIATQASAHAALERVRSGFFTVRGGHRIGICGTAVVKDGAVANLRQLSSLSIRVARQVPGVARAVLPQLLEEAAQAWLELALPLWEGDQIFLDLLERDAPFFSLKLQYEGDTLVLAVLDGKRLV